MSTIRGPEGPKRHRILLAALLLAAGAACAQNSGSEEDAFLRQVLVRNPTIRTDSFTLAGARETRTGYVSLLLPQFNVAANTGTYSDFDRTNGYTGNGSGTASQLLGTGGTVSAGAEAGRIQAKTPLATRNYDTIGLGVAFNQHFLKGFGEGNDTLYQIAQAKADEKIQLYTSRGEVLSVLSQARAAWWSQRALEAMLAADIEDSLRTYRLLIDSRQKQKEGSGSVLDTLSAYADHLQARSNWLTAWTSACVGAIELGSYLDTGEIWIGDPTKDTQVVIPPQGMLTSWPSVDSLLKIAEKDAPDIAEALASEEKARSAKIYTSRQTLPSLDGGVWARKAFLPDDATKNIVLGVQASFNWNIPDGVNRAAARKAILDLRKAGIASAKARSDLRRSLLKYLGQSQQYALSIDLERQVIEAKHAQLLADEQSYRDGSLSWTDLSAARKDWLAAVGTAWNAVASAQSVESSIQSLTGTGPARLGWNWGE